MRELLEYLVTIPWESQGIDGKAWVNVEKIIQDTEMSRDEIYLMAIKAKPRGFIRWSFFGLQYSERLSRLSITKNGIKWLN